MGIGENRLPVKITSEDAELSWETLKHMKTVLEVACNEAKSPFGVIVSYCDRGFQSKNIILNNHLYLCVNWENLFILVRDTDLNTEWMVQMLDEEHLELSADSNISIFKRIRDLVNT